MAYKVLYRKYRPQDFNNLFGQDNIKKLLIDSIIKEKLAHAYLFSGPRGTGKTSTAKLFAKTINCENPIEGIPCNSCKSCQNYEQSPDIIEIDAASNNGVDEIRDLRENAKILPTFSKYKVYIIDEVHMLSQSAWNAFLKILEEPPKHIIFILATTEFQKIPITILSRCQRYNFQRISNETISENIRRISKLEEINITEEAINYISELSDGGMRDALSLLDQLSKENTEITKDLIQKIFGVLGENDIEKIFKYFSEGNIQEFSRIFDEYSNKGLDVNLLISKIINYLYTLELKVISNEINYFTLEKIKNIANELIQCYSKKDAITMIKIILLSYFPKETEAKIISREIILDTKKEIISESKNEKIENIEIEEEKNEKIDKRPENITDLIKIRINNSFVNANKQEKEKFKKSWESFIQAQILKNNVELLTLIEDVNIEVVSSTNVLFSHKSRSTALLFNETIIELEKEFKLLEKNNKKFICISEEEWNKEKLEFINKKGLQYTYIEEPESIAKKEKTLNIAKDLFNEEIIEIN